MSKDYYPSINMLRGIAALMVCVFHFTTYSDIHIDLFSQDGLTYKIGKYGILGVYIFFIITGFVIPLSLIKHDFKLNQIHKFLTKRWIRIEIPYLISILFILLVSLVFSIKNNTIFELDFTRLFHHLLYSASFFDYNWYNPIYWTLAIEMQFYILIAFAYPVLKFRNKILNCLLPLFLSLTTLICEDQRFVFHYGSIFSQGIFLLFILKNKLNNYLGLVCILLSFAITAYTNGLGIAVASILTVGVIAFFNIDNKSFNKLGDISYSLYLIHGLTGMNLIYLFGRYANDFFTKMMLVLGALILSLVISYIYWRLVENPSKKWSSKIKLSKNI